MTKRNASIFVNNTESIGLWVEKVICDISGIKFTSSDKRAYVENVSIHNCEEFINSMKTAIRDLKIKKHMGCINAVYDFILEGEETLSVKSNISSDKICPPGVGQTTLNKLGFENNQQFKNWVISRPHEAFKKYYDSMNVNHHNIYVNFKDGYILYYKRHLLNDAVLGTFSFTRDADAWKESCTMKLDGKSVAEFQVHGNRNCVKCRINMNPLTALNLFEYEKTAIPKQNIKVQKSLGSFNYIGSKTQLADYIYERIYEYTGCYVSEFYDIFAGTGSMSLKMIESGCNSVITNDNQYYSYVLTSSITNKGIRAEKMSEYIKELNALEVPNVSSGYIHKTYASGKRMYFTEENARKIDAIRDHLDLIDISQQEKLFLIRTLLYAATRVANVASTYGAFLKKYKKSALVPIRLVDTVALLQDSKKVSVKNYRFDVLSDEFTIVGGQGSVAYLDPPYNNRKYSANYFVLESIATNSKPMVKNGITNIPVEEPTGSGNFCSVRTARSSFSKLFAKIKTQFLVMSYNSESIVSKDDIIELMKKTGWSNIIVYEKEYKRFKSNTLGDQSKSVIEYLFCATALDFVI